MYAVYLSVAGLLTFGCFISTPCVSWTRGEDTSEASTLPGVPTISFFASSFLPATAAGALTGAAPGWAYAALNFSGFSIIYLLIDSICWLVWLY